MKILKHLIAFAFILGTSSMASAAIPPPPVNQNLGIPDTSFSNFSADLCKACHWASARGDEPLSGAPVKPGYNPDRHHLAIDTEIDGSPEFPPFRDGDGDGVNDTHFSCFNCHRIITQGVDIKTAVLSDVIYFNYRNCLNCHKRDVPDDGTAGPLTVHHATELAQTGFCFRCHGGLVRGIDVVTHLGKKPDPNSSDPNATVPVVIPTGPVSFITPWRSQKPNADFLTESSAGTHPGNCNFCHNTKEGTNVIQGDKNGTIELVNLPDGSTFSAPILSNAQNHHNTGFFKDQRCAWCHQIDGEFQNGGQAIRVCQRCHDRTTLHNIEFDNDRDGIVPGQEDPYYGHIGNKDNCWGCHGNNKQAVDDQGQFVDPRDNFVYNQGVVDVDETLARMSVSRALIPTINLLSRNSVAYGEETSITIIGNSIANSGLEDKPVLNDDGSNVFDDMGNAMIERVTTVWSSDVVLTDSNDNVIVIVSDYQDTGKLEFTLPATLAIGSYTVTLKKEGHISNPMIISVVPVMAAQLAISLASYEGLVVLSGGNFMESINGMTYTFIDQNGQAPLQTYIWRDDLIVALFENAPESVTIEHIFDKRTFEITEY